MSIQPRQIGPTEDPILREIKSIPTADIRCCRLAHLHGSLRPGGVRAPHTEIVSEARLRPINRVRNSIERRGWRHGSGLGCCQVARAYVSAQSHPLAMICELARCGGDHSKLINQQSEDEQSRIYHFDAR